MRIEAVDLFCGVGGLSYGLKDAKIKVKAGFDIDDTCKFAYEKNNKAKFMLKDIKEVHAQDIIDCYGVKKDNKGNDIYRVLVGCAPCQPFSTHSQKNKNRKSSDKYGMLYEFSRVIRELYNVGETPIVVSMENVPAIVNEDIFDEFVNDLKDMGYYVEYNIVYCPDYGIPQSRRRLVLLASKKGKIELISPTHAKEEYVTVKSVIGTLPELQSGGVDPDDPLHRCSKLSEKNHLRIQHSRPGGSWRDWPEELILNCHKKDQGKTYGSVYGRMEWDKVGPTITTMFYILGTGRFGHPEQNRALSIREGALLQTFPLDYEFIQDNEVVISKHIARQIGNAVPVKLGEVIGKSIRIHLKDNTK